MCVEGEHRFGCKKCVASILGPNYGWIECKSFSYPGKAYYFHTVTECSTWIRPVSRRAFVPPYARFRRFDWSNDEEDDDEFAAPLNISKSNESVRRVASKESVKKSKKRGKPEKLVPRKVFKIIAECGGIKTISYDPPISEIERLLPATRASRLSESSIETFDRSRDECRSKETIRSNGDGDDSRRTKINVRIPRIKPIIVESLNLSETSTC